MTAMPVEFILLGHDCPLGEYPSVVVPVGRVDGQLAVLYSSSNGPEFVPVAAELHYVAHSPQTTKQLSKFDAQVHGLFAVSEDYVMHYPIGSEADFCAKFLETESSKALEPFYRLSLAIETGEPRLISPAFEECFREISEVPELTSVWIRDIAAHLSEVRALPSFLLPSISENPAGRELIRQFLEAAIAQYNLAYEGLLVKRMATHLQGLALYSYSAHLSPFIGVHLDRPSLAAKVINITPNASARGLREQLEEEAQRAGKQFRLFVGAIYRFAVNNQDRFRGPLKFPRERRGKHIGAIVPESVKGDLRRWAKREQTSRGLLCCYILEKAIEDKMLEQIFDSDR